MTRDCLKNARRWVIKIGSTLLSSEKGINEQRIANVSAQIAQLRRQGHHIVLVSSGAIAEGMQVLNLTSRPHQLHNLQALAAIGQMRLMRAWENHFSQHGFHSAQILLTHAELHSRERYLNAKTTIQTLLDMQVIPVANENDAIANEEIRFGDNDTLAALVSSLIQADALIILTDQAGMYDSNPRTNPDATLLHQVDPHAAGIDAMVDSRGSAIGSGGMVTKLQAAKLCAKGGISTVIASGLEKNTILRVAAGEAIGTWLPANTTPIAARKHWLLSRQHSAGRLHIDAGAVRAIHQGKSLLPIGVETCEGAFQRGDLVKIMHNGSQIGQGLVQYPSGDCTKILKKSTTDIENTLGYIGSEELIHQNDLVLL